MKMNENRDQEDDVKNSLDENSFANQKDSDKRLNDDDKNF